MSNSHLVQWFESLLFGGGFSCPPPPSVQSFILRMESENIPWSHLIESGGLTEFAHDVHGDLNTLLDYLEGLSHHPPSALETHPPPRCFKTRAVSRFWDELQLLWARQEPEPAPAPSLNDEETLRHLMQADNGACDSKKRVLRFQSAEFWGDVARRFINLRRSGPSPSDLPALSSKQAQRVLQLYTMTSHARGKYWDPYNLHLVPHAEFVNAVHWQTPTALEAFMVSRPHHPLTLCVQHMVNRTVDQILRAEKPLHCTDLRLDSFLYNVKRIHETVEQVDREGDPAIPPRLIDVLQRLIALGQLDGVWEKEVPVLDPATRLLGTTLLNLTEKLRMAERECQFLLDQHDEASRPKQPKRTCPLLYGKGKKS